MPSTPRSLLMVVSGKPGAGKTTLARRLSENDALGPHVLTESGALAFAPS